MKMKEVLKDEFNDFKESLHKEQTYGLRVNTLKGSVDQLLDKQPFSLRSIPWSKTGFYYDHEERPGKHPYHEAGVYYIQEPSAMAVVELMDPQPGEKILDLAAAPGGKATHIAAKLNGSGLLVANDIHPRRANVLSENIERMGIRNCVVTNEKPEHLTKHFPSFFDRILVDAPCSGEGMFRKNPDAIGEWSEKIVQNNARRQLRILVKVDQMLKVGGRLVYSTCTFSPEENEQIIESFLKQYPNYKLEEVPSYEDFSQGLQDNIASNEEVIEKTIRLWPHKLEGEGHFIAILTKTDGPQARQKRTVRIHQQKRDLKWFQQFTKEFLHTKPKGVFTFFGDQLYITPQEMVELKGLRIKRAGWHIGMNKRNRFEPSHALALSLHKNDVQHTLELAVTDERVQKYLRGETFPIEATNGWYVIVVDGYTLGWGKVANQEMKNHYPRGLRWQG